MLLYSQANTDRLALSTLPAPEPQGRYHRPYPFINYIEDVTGAVNDIGFDITAEEYQLTKQDQQLFGVMAIQPKVLEGEYIAKNDSDYKLLVGLRGAHDQTLPRGLVLGSQVMVCSNLCFSGNIGEFTTKQTLKIADRLPLLINEVVKKIPDLAEQQDKKFAMFKEHKFENKREGDSLLVDIYRQKGMSSVQLGRAIEQWDKPAYLEHEAYGWSAWRLMNAVTQALKPINHNINHNTLVKRTTIMDNYLSNYVGLKHAA